MKKAISFILAIILSISMILPLSGCSLEALLNLFNIGDFLGQLIDLDNVLIDEYLDGDRYVIGSQEYTIGEEGLKEVNIIWINDEVEIVQDSSFQQIEIVENDEIEEEAKKVHSLYENGILNICFAESGYQGSFKNIDKKLTVRVPLVSDKINISNVLGNISSDELSSKNITIINTTGSIKIKKVNAEGIGMTSVSGSISLDDLTSSMIAVASVSGNINIKKLLALEEVTIENTSGSIKIDNSITENLTCGSISGSINLSNMNAETATITSTSGKINLDIFGVNNLNVSTASSAITIKLPESGATITFNTTSGSITSPSITPTGENENIYGDGEAEIIVSTTSGSLKIDGFHQGE